MDCRHVVYHPKDGGLGNLDDPNHYHMDAILDGHFLLRGS